MVIGLVTTGFDKGGLEQIVFDLYKGYRKAGVKAYILCQQHQPDAYFVSRLHNDDSICFFEDSFERFITFCYQKRITHLHYHHNTSFIEQVQECGIQTLYTIHNAYTWFDDTTMRQWSSMVDKCDHVIAVSSFVKDYFCARTDIPSERVIVVPNGVDLEDIQRTLPLPRYLTRTGLDIQAEDVVFAQLAAYSAIKYPLGLVGVMEHVIQQCPNTKLLLVGHLLEEEYYQKLCQAVEVSPARNNIFLLDYVPHEYVGSFLRETVDISVLTSLQEGFGNVIVEGMACQTPLILNKTGYASDIQDPGILVVDPPYQELQSLCFRDLLSIAENKECSNTQALVDAFVYAVKNLDSLKCATADWPQKAERMNVQTMSASYLAVLGYNDKVSHETQVPFFVRMLCQNLPDFLKAELENNEWSVTVNNGADYLIQQFSKCQFTVWEHMDKPINATDVVFFSGPFVVLNDFNRLMEQMCAAAEKHVVLLLPLEKITGTGKMLTLDMFPLYQNDFYLESSNLIDGTQFEDTMWPGDLLLAVYTSRTYRPERLTLQDIHERFIGAKDQHITYLQTQSDIQQRKSTEQKAQITRLNQENQTLETQICELKIRTQELGTQTEELEARARDIETQAQVRIQETKLQAQTRVQETETQAKARIEKTEAQAQACIQETKAQAQAHIEEVEVQARTLIQEAMAQAQTRIEEVEAQTQARIQKAEEQAQAHVREAEIQAQARVQEAETQAKTHIQEITVQLHKCQNEIVVLEDQVAKFQQTKNKSHQDMLIYRKAARKAETELTLKGESLEKYQRLLAENQSALLEAHEAISQVQHSKAYRICLFLRRAKFQLFQGGWAERKDFFRWCWGKLHKKIVGRPLQDFDEMVMPLQKLLWRSEENSQMDQSIRGQNIDGIIPKDSRQIYIFAGVAYYDVGGGQRSAQLANAFNSMGYEVHYIYGFDSSESKRETMYLPVYNHLHIDNYSLQMLSEIIQPNAVFIFESPYSKFIPYLDYANAHGCVTVYEHIDNWDSSLGSAFYNKDDFQHFIDTVQYITVTARILGEKIEEVGRKDYLYSANAVDSSLFEPTRSYEKPTDLVLGKRTLLYFGSLWGEWFDWDLILYVAKNVDCSINLIGDYQFIIDRLPPMPDNVHFLGLKKHEVLPAYLAYSDFALLPFKKSVIGKYVSPLKIFEYIAMNKPVLATPLDDIIGYPNTVLSEDPKVWAKVVQDGVCVQDSTIFTAENSWYARCNQLLDLVGREEKCYPSISIVILNRNNMKVIFRCVSSLLTFSSAYDAEIIVVDNDSTDGSYERLQKEYGNRIKLIKNNKNGCSSGRNLGVSVATGKLLLFLDSDQWVISQHYIDAALDLILTDSSVGAVGWAAGWFNPGAYGGPIADYLPNRGIKAPWILCRTDIAYLGSGGLLMMRSLFEQVGGFDEYYDPTCFEDTDLSLKIRHAGYELAYCPYMNIMHLPHQTTESGSSGHAALMARNSKYFSAKWEKLDPALLNHPLH